jgi:hypothetical protein
MLAIELARLTNWGVLPLADAALLFEEPDLNDVMHWAHTLPPAEQTELLEAIAGQLAGFEPLKASGVLVMGGGLVEGGADPDALVPAGMQHLARLRELFEEGEAPPEEAWRYAVISLMTMLCRSAAARAQWRAQADLIAWLQAHEDVSGHFFYLLRAAEMSDEDKLLILFPAYETGLEIAISQVNNGFQLLTLVQPLVRAHAAALGLRRPPAPTDPALLRYVQGDPEVPEADGDVAQLNWLNALAYQGGPLDSLQLVWGEMPVSALPRVQGVVVLLATDDEHRMQRSWDLGFLSPVHGANCPQVSFNRYVPAAEVRAVLAEIHLPVAPASGPASPAPTPTRSWWQRLLGR